MFPTPARYAGSWPPHASGIVTAVYIVDGGEGYNTTPIVRIDPPVVDSTTGIGVITFNEIVTGSISGTTARVKE